MLCLAAPSGFCFKQMSAGFKAWSRLGEYAHAAVSQASFCEASFLSVDAFQSLSSQACSFPLGRGGCVTGLRQHLWVPKGGVRISCRTHETGVSPVPRLVALEQVEILAHTNHSGFVQVSVADCRCSLHLIMHFLSLGLASRCLQQLAKEGVLPRDLSCLSCD